MRNAMKRQTEERAKEETAAEAERTLARRTGQEGGAAAVKLESGAHTAAGKRGSGYSRLLRV